MKRILILIHVLFCGYICPLLAEDTGAVRYQDSILKVADALPAFGPKYDPPTKYTLGDAWPVTGPTSALQA